MELSFSPHEIEPSFVSYLANEWGHKPILLATSGGVDSVVLAHLLHAAKLDFSIAHCNFNLRGEDSINDQALVEQLAKDYKVPFFSKSFHITKNVQLQARQLRYKWFDELCSKHRLDYIFTAHHLNDSLETTFINMQRGSGVRGIRGIAHRNGEIVRPLLSFTKQAIREYATAHKLRWREDLTNQDTKYLRNAFRLQYVDQMTQDPLFVEGYQRTKQILSEQSEIIDEALAMFIQRYVTTRESYSIFDIERYNSTPQPHILRQWLADYTSSQIADLLHLVDTDTVGKVVEIKGSKRIFVRERQHLIILEDTSFLAPLSFVSQPIQTLDHPVRIPYAEVVQLAQDLGFDGMNTATIQIDASRAQGPYMIDLVKSQDYIITPGGKKKVSKFLRDSKCPHVLKNKVLTIRNINSEVLGLFGFTYIFVETELTNQLNLPLCIE